MIFVEKHKKHEKGIKAKYSLCKGTKQKKLGCSNREWVYSDTFYNFLCSNYVKILQEQSMKDIRLSVFQK